MRPHVKHLRLFGYSIDTSCTSVRWLLQHTDTADRVEYIEVNGIAGEARSPAFENRNVCQTLPFLEVVIDGTKPWPHVQTRAVSNLMPWKPETPCTVQTAKGETIAEPSDRVFPLTEAGAIGAFLCEHFGVTDLWNPKSVFQRCRVQELACHHDLLARRVSVMGRLFIFTTAQGLTPDEISAAILVHERELLWSFRLLENELEANERRSAAVAGVDYAQLLEQGRHDVAAQEAAVTADGNGLVGNIACRDFTSAPLVALAAYVGRQALSVADFMVASELQLLPYLQAWLPASLRQRNFPAMLRYLARMRHVSGYDDALKPRLTLLKRFRRSPWFMSSDPFMGPYAARVRQAVALKGRGGDHSAPHRSDPRLLPQQHSRSLGSPRDADARSTSFETLPKRRGRSPALTEWASRLCAAPVCSPCTLSDKDEALLRRSRKPAAKAMTQSATRLRKPDALHAGHVTPAQDVAPSTGPRSRTTAPRAWRHDPYTFGGAAAVFCRPD